MGKYLIAGDQPGPYLCGLRLKLDVVHNVLVCVAAVWLIAVGEIKSHGFDLPIGQSQLIVKHLVEFFTPIMLRKESYEPILDFRGCRWEMVSQSLQTLPQAVGPVVILHLHPPTVQVNEYPLFRSPAMPEVMAQGFCFIRQYLPERNAKLCPRTAQRFRETSACMLHVCGGLCQQSVQICNPVCIFTYQSALTPLFHDLI